MNSQSRPKTVQPTPRSICPFCQLELSRKDLSGLQIGKCERCHRSYTKESWDEASAIVQAARESTVR